MPAVAVLFYHKIFKFDYCILRKMEEGENPDLMSRRDFLKKGLAAGAAFAFRNIKLPEQPKPGNETPKQREVGEVLTPADNSVFVDIKPDYNNQEAISRTIERLSTNHVQNPEDIKWFADEISNRYTGHGDFVAGKFTEELSSLGYSTEMPSMLPLQEALKVTEFSRDELGNPSLVFEVDEQVIGDQLEQHFSQHPNTKTVNLSLEIGNARLTHTTRQIRPIPITNEIGSGNVTDYVTVATDIAGFEGTADGRTVPFRLVNDQRQLLNPSELLSLEQYAQLNEQHRADVIADYQAGRQTDQIETINRKQLTEMYNPEFARANLTRLAALCRRFPDKSFNVAGGNENSWFYSVRQEMETSGQWPDNLTIWAGNERRSDGADIYNKSTLMSSSEATARGSALDSILATKNVDLQARKATIRGYCTEFNFLTDGGRGPERNALALEPSHNLPPNALEELRP